MDDLDNALSCFRQTWLTQIFIIDEVHMINDISSILVTLLYSSHAHLSPVDSLPLASFHHITVMLPPFHFVALHIDQVRLFVLDALPIDKFPSLVANVSGKGHQPLAIIKFIYDDILPLANVNQVSVAHFCLESYLISLPAWIPSCCIHHSISLHFQWLNSPHLSRQVVNNYLSHLVCFRL